MPASKKPSFQFYPGDWMKDPELRRCSASARGVWIDLICIAHECSDRGRLSTNGVAWPLDDIGRALSGDLSDNLCALNELFKKGVLKQSEDGTFYVQRIVRDEQKAAKCSKAGKLGGGNPEWKRKGQDKGDAKGRSKGSSKRKPKASSSSSSSSSEFLSTYVESEGLESWMLSDEFKSAWERWVAFRIEIKHRMADTTMESQLANFAKVGLQQSINAIEESIRNGWQGLFFKPEQHKTSNDTNSQQNDPTALLDALNARQKEIAMWSEQDD